MAFYTISWHLRKPPVQSLPGPGEEALKVFLFGALCYTICTMKAPPQALEGPGEEPSWHLQKPPLQGLESLHGVPVRCSALYNMHFQGLGRSLHGI